MNVHETLTETLIFAGAILEEADELSELAFLQAVDFVNTDPDHSLSRFRLDGVVIRVPPSDAFHAHKAGESFRRRNEKHFKVCLSSLSSTGATCAL